MGVRRHGSATDATVRASSFLRALAVVATLAVLASSCTSGDRPESASPGGPKGSWAGKVAGTKAFIAIVSDSEHLLAYVCEDGKISEWFWGQPSGRSLTLRSSHGATLTATLAKTTRGVVTLADGSEHVYSAARTSEPALYRAEAGRGKARRVAGWVALPNGEIQGAVDGGTSPGGAPTTGAPPTGGPQDNLELAGQRIQPSPMTPDTVGSPNRNRVAFRWAGLGDSMSAGEGNPESPIADPDKDNDFTGLRWGNDKSTFVPFEGGSLESDVVTCHRSDEAAIPKANRALKERYPEVRFSLAFLACSGAKADDLVERGHNGPEFREEARLGQPQVVQPAQLDRAEDFAEKHGGLDALYFSVGPNDIDFDELVAVCLAAVSPADPVNAQRGDGGGCMFREPLLEEELDFFFRVSAKGNAFGGLKRLNTAIDERFPSDLPVLASLYGNVLHNGSESDNPPVCHGSDYDEHGEVGVGGHDDFLQDNLTIDEAIFGFGIPGKMNEKITLAARHFGWTTVAGDFDGHGVCTDVPFANLNSRGLETQGYDLPEAVPISAGFFHPNDAGYEAISKALVGRLRQIVDRKVLAGLQPPIGTRVAEATDGGEITIRWNDRATSENAYEIQVTPARIQDRDRIVVPDGARRLGGGFVDRIEGANIQEYKHVPDGRGLFGYRVRACNTAIGGSQCGAFGQQIFGANFLPAVPSGFEFTTVEVFEPSLGRKVAGIRLSWKPQREAIEYVVEVAPAPGKEGRREEIRTSLTRVEMALFEARNKEFRVSACNRVDCSRFSQKLRP